MLKKKKIISTSIQPMTEQFQQISYELRLKNIIIYYYNFITMDMTQI